MITGFYESPNISFGGFTLGNAGYRPIYFVKYDTNGNVKENIFVEQCNSKLS